MKQDFVKIFRRIYNRSITGLIHVLSHFLRGAIFGFGIQFNENGVERN